MRWWNDRRALRGLVLVGALLAPAACEAIAGLHDVPTPVDAGVPESGIDAGQPEASQADASVDASDGAPLGDGGADASAEGDAGADAADATVTPPPVAPSCAPGGPGMTTCGDDAESCCTSLEVEGGAYERTYEAVEDGSVTLAPDGGATGLGDPATVSGFRLDKYEVTVGRFRQFVAAWNGGSGWRADAGAGKHTHLNGGLGLVNSAVGAATGLVVYEPGWVATDDANVAPTDTNLLCDSAAATWTGTPGPNESRPMSCENWWESYAFCIWDGGFLPSEAEWEYASAGGSEQREYPWGSADPGSTNQYAIFGDGLGDCFYPAGTLESCTGVANIALVGTPRLGAGAWGQLDLAGNVDEWVLDSNADYVSPCVDCAYITTNAPRIIRGGDFYYDVTSILPADRYYTDPTARLQNFGFRCARTP